MGDFMHYDYEWFKREVLKLTTIDLNLYKEQQMKRRIDSLVSKHALDDYQIFIREIQKNKTLYDEFLSFITINVSEFYRNPDQWNVLEKIILPELFTKYGKNLKIWSAACSTGDEPYTLVMLLAEYMPLENVKVFATDLDKKIIEKAKIGVYDQRSLTGLPEKWKKKYFTFDGHFYTIDEKIKNQVEFKPHNLLQDAYPTGCHLIVCRNVLIYFTEDAKDAVFRKFNQSLVKDGILFIGSTEQMMNHQGLGYERQNLFFYKKTP